MGCKVAIIRLGALFFSRADAYVYLGKNRFFRSLFSLFCSNQNFLKMKPHPSYHMMNGVCGNLMLMRS